MIEKILERLEEVRMRYFLTIANGGSAMLDFAYGYVGEAIDQCKEIVQEVAKDGGWISVEERLPEDFETIYATCVSLVDNREPWTIEGFYHSASGWERMSPMLQWGKAKVIAWMHKELPAPYQKGE